MPRRRPPDPESTRFRRRVILELVPDEMKLLDQATTRYGTKRAALVACLRAEAERAGSPGAAGLAHDHPADAEARTRAADDHETRRTLEELRAEHTALVAQLAALRMERDEARAEVARLAACRDTEFAETREQYRLFAEDIAALEDRIPEALYCAHCNRWAPEDEWAWREDGTATVAHHAPCGDHGPGVLSAASWLARNGGPEKSTP
jgi:hypothetical protein